MENEHIKLLLVEDNPGDARLLREKLAEAASTSFELECSDRLSTGLERLSQGGIDVVLLDLSLPDSLGLETLLRTLKHNPQIPIIVMTGLDDETLGRRAIQQGAQDYLVKGQTDSNMLVRSIRYAIERHQMLLQLEQTQKQQLAMKDQLLSHVSHELRTPLASLHQFVTILLDGLVGNISPEQREYLEIILAKANELRTMVSDLLDATRVRTGKIMIDPQHLSVTDLILETQRSFRIAATAKGITLSSNIAADLPPAYADADRVRQILTNLIDNAIKFTAQGGTITVGAKVFKDNPNFICISVTDTGCGISPEDCGRIFEYLYQASHEIESTRKGLGLGLYICKELVSRHGGRIWVESKLGEGSTFFFTLPVFSLGKLLAPILTPQGLLEGSVSVITVRIRRFDGRELLDTDDPALQDIWKILQQSITAGIDVLLPRMARTKLTETFFVVTCGNQGEVDNLVQSIRKQTTRHIHLQNTNLESAISCNTIHAASSNTDNQLGQLIKGTLDKIQNMIESANQERHSVYAG